MRTKCKVFTAAVLVAILALAAGCGGGSKGGRAGKVVIGSKEFTESIVLGEMVAQLIEENTDIQVERKLNLGGTKVNFDGIRNGDLDMYVEYDGTAYAAHLGHTEPITDRAGFFDHVNKELQEKFGLTFTAPLGFNNTYTLAMPRKLAEQYGIETFSDLVPHSRNFAFVGTTEFMARSDGYEPLVEAYGFTFKSAIQMKPGLRWAAIEDGSVQVIDAFATDGNLKAFDMKILEDDKDFFPPYNAAVLVRMDTLEANPGLKELLDSLGGRLSDEKMQELNYRVAMLEEDPADVARDFLKSEGLIP